MKTFKQYIAEKKEREIVVNTIAKGHLDNKPSSLAHELLKKRNYDGPFVKGDSYLQGTQREKQLTNIRSNNRKIKREGIKEYGKVPKLPSGQADPLHFRPRRLEYD